MATLLQLLPLPRKSDVEYELSELKNSGRLPLSTGLFGMVNMREARNYMTLRRYVGILRSPVAAVRDRLNRNQADVPGTITSVTTRDPVVALTFDDGPHPEYTPRLLDILQRYQASATFFMIGEVAQKHPELVQRVAQAGHAIGNHSWDHRFFPSLPGRIRREQIRKCEQVLAQYGQRLFRPPYGAQSLASRFDVLWLRYKVVTWNLEAKDWREDNPKSMADRLVQGIRPGSIVLLHDAIYRSNQTVPQYNREPMLIALTSTLEQLSGRFRFVTIPELLRHGKPRWRNFNIQDDASLKNPVHVN
jgi:peptidoglycan-N-acetylglucosamine deacetylase